MAAILNWDYWDMWTFITVMVMIFALVLVVTGLFTAYFGSGKSRGIGIGLFMFGLLVGLFYAYMAWTDGYLPEDIYLGGIIVQALMYLLSAIVGALVALGVFLGAIMKA